MSSETEEDSRTSKKRTFTRNPTTFDLLDLIEEESGRADDISLEGPKKRKKIEDGPQNKEINSPVEESQVRKRTKFEDYSEDSDQFSPGSKPTLDITNFEVDSKANRSLSPHQSSNEEGTQMLESEGKSPMDSSRDVTQFIGEDTLNMNSLNVSTLQFADSKLNNEGDSEEPTQMFPNESMNLRNSLKKSGNTLNISKTKTVFINENVKRLNRENTTVKSSPKIDREKTVFLREHNQKSRLEKTIKHADTVITDDNKIKVACLKSDNPQYKDIFILFEEIFVEEIKEESGFLLLGRSPSCLPCCRFAECPKVSVNHCKLYVLLDKGEYKLVVEDLSSNGTFINGIKIGKHARNTLQFGDVLSLFVPKVRQGSSPISFKYQQVEIAEREVEDFKRANKKEDLQGERNTLKTASTITSDTVEQIEKEMNKEACKYGACCYRKSKEHRNRFYHPNEEENK